MATGDNILTAISVARECNIISANAAVFIGDYKKEFGKEKIVW
jgi:magnesium-transporting ATPase (P-type)